MKHFIYCLVLISVCSCNQNKPIVKESFVDTLISNYTPSTVAVINEKDLAFWKSRVDTMPESLVDLKKYASALASRFHIYGDINDLKQADSIMQKLVDEYKEPGSLLTLAGYKMLQHQFSEAKKCIDTVIEMKAEKYATQMMLFDADFELGDLYHASLILRDNYSPREYAYNFRQSKLDHNRGELGAAIEHMLKAAELSGSAAYLRTAALSNAADLCIHDGNLKKAANLYEQCIQFNSCDFHSVMGLGWIALVHDKNEKLATKIFSFVRDRMKSPDALLKLSQASELTDSTASKEYAMEFVKKASGADYGNMYNKYLIQLYTGILNDPASALAIAQKEISNRATSQTYAWLAWTLFASGKQQGAYQVFQNHVSGRSLEALELYWMGRMMKGLGKGYNEQQFFKAAEKNKYDLSPEMRKDLENNLW
jgi:tetratricopeptide (TPR) repeat protein